MPRDIKPGLLISFDGLDSSGKATQSRLLVERLRLAGYKTRHFSSPDYSTPSGEDLKVCLQNKAGEWKDLPWQEKMKLFADNRAEHREEAVTALVLGEMVVYDRYVPSSMAFMTVEACRDAITDSGRQAVHEAVQQQEYVMNLMPPENVSIFLDVPAAVTCGLLKTRQKVSGHDDEYTDTLKVQERLYSEYDWLCQSDPEHYLRIHCFTDNVLLLVDDVTELVWQALVIQFPFLKITL